MRALSITTDSLSPMLIKELRQGLKSKSFYFAFLLMQGLMFFSVLMLASTMEAGRSPDGVNTMFWVCLGAPLVVITPLRALGGLVQEIKGNTLELIFLTRLSAWRIVTGKWTALFSQAVLLTVAAMPYLFLRYFIGGINVSEDLLTVLWLLLTSATMTALGVCFSAFRALWARVLVVIAFVFGTQFMAGFLMVMRFGGSSSPFSGIAHPGLYGLMIAAAMVVAILLMLFWGAGRIAPAAENYSRWKRLLTLLLLGCVAGMTWASGEEEMILLALVVLVPLCIDVLGEKPLLFPSVYQPFVKLGATGRLLSFFFAPGWPSGVFFTLLCCALFALAIPAFDIKGDEITWLVVTLPGALLFPPAVVLMVRPRAENLLGGIIGVLVGSVILAVIALAVHDSHRNIPIGFMNAIPTCSIIVGLSDSNATRDWAWVTAITTVMSLIFLFVRMRPVSAEIARNYQLAAQQIAARRTPAAAPEPAQP